MRVNNGGDLKTREKNLSYCVVEDLAEDKWISPISQSVGRSVSWPNIPINHGEKEVEISKAAALDSGGSGH